MSAEESARWIATAVAVAALAVLAWQVGEAAGPILAAVVVLVPAAVLAIVLWRRALDGRAYDREAAQLRSKAEPYRGPIPTATPPSAGLPDVDGY